MKDLQQKIGDRLRQLRLEQEYSLEELAYRAELNTAHLSKIVRGELNFTLATLEKVVTALDTSFTEVFTFEPKEEVPEPYLLKTAACMKDLTLKEREHVYRTARILAQKKQIKKDL